MHIIVTGGCGFIGSALVRHLMANTDWSVTNIDILTYAANTANTEAEGNPRYTLVQADIADAQALDNIFQTAQPDGLIHLAAESHVDRSIDGPDAFIRTNIMGTYELLQATRRYLQTTTPEKREAFRFHHVSTDEVFGALEEESPAFEESTAYDPRSPYSASKAASDHLASAWYHTFNLPVVMSNCSNNYGPYQYPEKLIPATILRAISGQPVNVYGEGLNIRDWIHVDDHVTGLLKVFTQGQLGQSYNIGGYGERRNIEVVHAILTALDTLHPRADGHSYKNQITFVKDRPGHDFRYAINPSKMKDELNWQAAHTFEDGIRETVQWYLSNQSWWNAVADNATQRIGTNIIPLKVA